MAAAAGFRGTGLPPMRKLEKADGRLEDMVTRSVQCGGEGIFNVTRGER